MARPKRVGISSLAVVAVMVALATGCAAPGPTSTPARSRATGAPAGSAEPPVTTLGSGRPASIVPSVVAATPAISAPSTAPTPGATPVDLSARPLAWFAPLPPMPGRTGSTDFMAQFQAGAPWSTAARYIGVYKLYGEWVAYHATPNQLREAVAGIASRGMALAVEAGPLDATSGCGTGVESFAGLDEGRLIAARILAAGGRIDIIAFDEPYFFAHVYDGPNACHWPLDRIAAGVVAYRDQMRAVFPAVVIGDTEPLPAPVSAAGLGEWLDAYRAAGGEPFAFLHLDADWSRSGWPALAQEAASSARSRGVPIGMIYNGGSETDRAAWIALAGARVKAFEAAGSAPDHVLFQSWMLQPDRVLPDTDPATFSGLVVTYFRNHAALGSVPGAAANLALGHKATGSRSIAGSPAKGALDGDPDTLWSSGTGPPGWIEVDLGGVHTIADVRLIVSQYPAGPTDHRLYARLGNGSLVLLHRFHGMTEDEQVLRYVLPTPMRGVKAIRVETVASPSWVAWREVEVFGP